MDLEVALADPRAALDRFDELRGGHGLVLLLARAIIEGHGGEINTRRGAEPGRDVTIVRLPLAEAP